MCGDVQQEVFRCLVVVQVSMGVVFGNIGVLDVVLEGFFVGIVVGYLILEIIVFVNFVFWQEIVVVVVKVCYWKSQWQGSQYFSILVGAFMYFGISGKGVEGCIWFVVVCYL